MTQTVQKTGKFWKLVQLIGVAGVVWGFVALSKGDPKSTGILAAGIVIVILGRLLAWWFHG